MRYLAGLRDDQIRQVGWTLLAEMREPTSTAQLLVQSLAHRPTARIAERYAAGSGSSGQERQHQLDERRLRRVLEYMAQHFEDDVSLDNLAAVACLSPFHFLRMFARRMGATPHRYLSGMRLERAKILLAVGHLGVSEIAIVCCFSPQSNFSRAFRRGRDESARVSPTIRIGDVRCRYRVRT